MDFIKKIPAGQKLLDLGCGNARLYQKLIKKKINYTGIDSSNKLIEIAKKRFRKANFSVKNILDLTYNNAFDYILCYAVFHHIPKYYHAKFVKNIYDSLKDTGKFQLSVWNRWQSKYRKYFYNKINKLKPKLIEKYKLEKNFFGSLEFKDLLTKWKDTIYVRYVYAFSKYELIKLFKKAGFKNIKCQYYKNGKISNYLNGLNLVIEGTK